MGRRQAGARRPLPVLPGAGESARFCPSARCEEGAILLGVVGADGTVGVMQPQLPVDAAFVARARAGRTPESRFRFAGRCMENGCGHWTGSRCGVIDAVVEAREAGLLAAPEGGLRPCAIRPQCRWFTQHGADACALCPLIVTEFTPEDETDTAAD